MSSIADDYEDFKDISTVATSWAFEDGLQLERNDIVKTLGELIQNGHAQCYLLSPQPPHASLTDYFESRIDELWFMLTAKGQEELIRLDAQ